MKLPSTLLLGCALCLHVVGCKKDDVGVACRPNPNPEGSHDIPAEPINGEIPVLEVVSLGRSSDCETFQCLTYGGYAPFCTRECSYDGFAKGRACTESSDCKRPEHCFEGYCRDDDCPDGFECRTVQDVGPLAGRLFCVNKTGCAGSNRECEALGTMECQRLACFDQSLLGDSTATAHTLGCMPLADLSYCQCPDGGVTCGGETLSCDPPEADPWPAGAVEVRDACIRVD